MKVFVSPVSDVAVAVIVIEPASAPVTVCEATPPDAVALPSPVSVPRPLVFANVTDVVLSLVTRLPPASRISTVSVRVFPEARSPVEPVKVRWSAVPATTLSVVEPEVSDAAEAVIVIEPATAPVTVLLAMPPAAVAVPSPLTVPVPLVSANVTRVVLSLVSRLPPASRISTVSVRVFPAARSAVELVKTRRFAAPGTMPNMVESEASVLAVAVIVTEPASAPATSFDAMPLAAVADPRPVTVPAPFVFANVTEVVLSLVARLPPASRISTLSVRAVPEARSAAELVKAR